MSASPTTSAISPPPTVDATVRRWGWVAWGAFAAALAVLYRDTAVQLVEVWRVDPNYSHGWLIPLACAYFAYEAWGKVGPPFRAGVPARTMSFGLAEVALGFVVHLAGWYVAQPLFDILGLVFILRGLLLVMGGAEVNRAYGFAAIFLLFGAPLPLEVYQPLATFLQELVAAVSTWILDFMQVPVYREGYRIFLPDAIPLDVAPACSGIRSITAFLALGVILAHLSDRGWVFKFFVGLMGIPIAVATNCVRVVLTALTLRMFGQEWATGVFHSMEGSFILIPGTILMVVLVLGLASLDDRFHWGGRPPTANQP